MRIKFKVENDLTFKVLGGINPKDILLINKTNDDILLFTTVNIEVISKDEIKVNNLLVNIHDIELRTMNSVADEYIKQESLYLKSIEDCLPTTEGYTGLERACINAMRMAKPLVLTQTQHNRKLAHLRELEKVKKGSKNSMSIPRLEELLGFYGLEITEVINPKYL